MKNCLTRSHLKRLWKEKASCRERILYAMNLPHHLVSDAGGQITVETEVEFPRLHHATMETHACIADYDPYQDRLTIYSPNQSVFGIRTMLADYLEMPYHHIRVVKAPMGGSFGGKQEWFTEPVAALIARELKRPVKLCFSRSEAMVSSYVRAPMKSRMTTCFDCDGTLRSLDLDVIADAGAYIGNTKDYMRTLYGKLFRCYRVPCAHYRARIISSNTPVSGAYRSWSAAEEAMMMEHNLNVAALRLGMDPIELRLKMHCTLEMWMRKVGFRLKRSVSEKQYCEVGNCSAGMTRKQRTNSSTPVQNVGDAASVSGVVGMAILISRGTTILLVQGSP